MMPESKPRVGGDTPDIPDLASLDREALSELAREHGLDLIVLFGSTAKGSRHPKSDLDVAVRFAGPRTRPPTLTEEARVEDALFWLLKPRSELDFAVLNGASPLLKRNVAQYGIPLFTASPAAWTLFRIRADRDYEDSARFRRRRWEVFLRRLGREPAER